MDDKEYDVVLDVLQKHYDKLWQMTKSNLDCEFLGMGIMDDIRLRQMDELKEAICWWKERKAQAVIDAVMQRQPR